MISSELPEVLASPTASSSCARAGSSPSSPTREATEERIVAAATGQLEAGRGLMSTVDHAEPARRRRPDRARTG